MRKVLTNKPIVEDKKVVFDGKRDYDPENLWKCIRQCMKGNAKETLEQFQARVRGNQSLLIESNAEETIDEFLNLDEIRENDEAQEKPVQRRRTRSSVKDQVSIDSADHDQESQSSIAKGALGVKRTRTRLNLTTSPSKKAKVTDPGKSPIAKVDVQTSQESSSRRKRRSSVTPGPSKKAKVTLESTVHVQSPTTKEAKKHVQTSQKSASRRKRRSSVTPGPSKKAKVILNSTDHKQKCQSSRAKEAKVRTPSPDQRMLYFWKIHQNRGKVEPAPMKPEDSFAYLGRRDRIVEDIQNLHSLSYGQKTSLESEMLALLGQIELSAKSDETVSLPRRIGILDRSREILQNSFRDAEQQKDSRILEGMKRDFLGAVKMTVADCLNSS
jgi:predicted RNA-binding protein with PUA-like domain